MGSPVHIRTDNVQCRTIAGSVAGFGQEYAGRAVDGQDLD